MAPSGIITVTAVLLCFILATLSPAPGALGARRPPCCTGYNRKPVPVQQIRGYREQNDTTVCRIKAIIFFTESKAKICADPKDPWVKPALEFLSTRLKKMSKSGPAAGGTPNSNGGKPSTQIKSDPFYTATEPFLNDTVTFE